jgi:hypothetical protein
MRVNGLGERGTPEGEESTFQFVGSYISTSLVPMSFSSNSTFSLCSKVEGEVMGSCPTGCMHLTKKNKKINQGHR